MDRLVGQLPLVALVDAKECGAVGLPSGGLPAELAWRGQQAQLDRTDRRARVARIDPGPLLAQRQRAQPLPLIERHLARAAGAGEALLAHQPPADAVKRARGDGIEARGAQALAQFDARVTVERCAQDPLRRHATAQQLTHALDQHGGLPAPGRRDHLHDSVVRPGCSQLPGVERERRPWNRPLGERLGAAAVQPRRHVDRPLERVRVLESRIDEPLGRQACEAVRAFDRDCRAGPQGGLEHVSVQCDQIAQLVQLHVDHRERVQPGNAGEPRLGGIGHARARLRRVRGPCCDRSAQPQNSTASCPPAAGAGAGAARSRDWLQVSKDVRVAGTAGIYSPHRRPFPAGVRTRRGACISAACPR